MTGLVFSSQPTLQACLEISGKNGADPERKVYINEASAALGWAIAVLWGDLRSSGLRDWTHVSWMCAPHFAKDCC